MRCSWHMIKSVLAGSGSVFSAGVSGYGAVEAFKHPKEYVSTPSWFYFYVVLAGVSFVASYAFMVLAIYWGQRTQFHEMVQLLEEPEQDLESGKVPPGEVDTDSSRASGVRRATRTQEVLLGLASTSERSDNERSDNEGSDNEGSRAGCGLYK